MRGNAVPRHLAGDAGAEGNPRGDDRRAGAAQHALEEQLALLLVEDERCGRIGAGQLCSARDGHIEEGGVVGGLAHLALHGIKQVQLAHLAALGREEPRVLHRDGELRRDRQQRLLVVVVERVAIDTVEDLHCAQHLAAVAPHRRAQD
jgi:hypothetical protein